MGKGLSYVAASFLEMWHKKDLRASSGNRTRAARVAGEHSTTEPTMLLLRLELQLQDIKGNTSDIYAKRTREQRGKKKSVHLPDGESNPGLPRDRRGYLPLYYRGLADERG